MLSTITKSQAITKLLESVVRLLTAYRREDMSGLRVSKSDPGKWCLEDRELTPGDSVEVWFLGKWYTAKVEYDDIFKEYRFRAYSTVIPLAEDTPARWPQPD